MAPSTRGWQMIEIIAALVALCLISVVMRVVARLKRRVGLGVHDYLSILSMVLMIAMLTELCLWCSIGGNGAHVKTLDAEAMINYWKVNLPSQPIHIFYPCPAIKISIICFYRRVFTTPKFQTCTFGLNILIGAWGLGIFLACAGQCRPLRAYWDSSVLGKCFDANKFFIVNQAFNVLMDFIILILPIPMIWNLHSAWQDKLALTGVFALGAFVCFASIYRIIVLFWISPSDPTYTVYQATLGRTLNPQSDSSAPSNRSNGPYHINTDISQSNILSKSSPHSPDVEYVKMEAGAYGATIDRMHGQFLGDDLHPLNVKVQTDIAMTPDNESVSSSMQEAFTLRDLN
ncbi:uncharacterized protein N7477_005062 [Penicillium maclennaniae]|uniref:uncharacterized protein n=1 Tax=Penicillium maclennaniae TaxID=1343394 RepID=UPI002540B29F|nr:uncharacterized protein N7477_005062 [Penicillium maclennaniae]KAJ5675128.1 hypothetical protein N7477_005062 [Penicillium maclennaniae]